MIITDFSRPSEANDRGHPLLPPDVLVCVFDHLGFHNLDYLSLEYLSDVHARGQSHRNDALRRMALVCKVWHSVAVGHLYGNLQISRFASIPLLFRTLKKSPALRNLVRTFTYIPGEGLPLKWWGKSPIQEYGKVARLCTALPNAYNKVDLHLKLVEQPSYPLLKSFSSKIRSLHLISGVPPSDNLKELAFPQLDSLTLERYRWHHDFSSILLDAPRLSTLRLVQPNLICMGDTDTSWLQSVMQQVKHLELHRVHSPFLDYSPSMLLQRCAQNLESIVMNLWDIRVQGGGALDLTRFVSLRRVTICTYTNSGGNKNYNASILFPSSLEHLVICEAQIGSLVPAKPCPNRIWSLVAAECTGIRRVRNVLHSVQEQLERTPNLGKVTFLGWEGVWTSADNRLFLEQIGVDLGSNVDVRVEVWKHLPSYKVFYDEATLRWRLILNSCFVAYRSAKGKTPSTSRACLQ